MRPITKESIIFLCSLAFLYLYAPRSVCAVLLLLFLLQFAVFVGVRDPRPSVHKSIWPWLRQQHFTAPAEDSNPWVTELLTAEQRRSVSVHDEFVRNSRHMRLHARKWLPRDGAIKGLVFFCHGFLDHSCGSPSRMCYLLANDGFAVVSLDYEGHGQSQGLLGYVPNFNAVVDDLIRYYTSVQQTFHQQNPRIKSILIAESLGGAMAVQMLRRKANFDACLLIAPMLGIQEHMKPHPVVVSVLKAIVPFCPTLAAVPSPDVTEAVRTFWFACVSSPVQSMAVTERISWCTRDPFHYAGMPRLGTALALVLLSDEVAAHLDEVKVPFLILHGTADVVTNPRMSQMLVDKASSKQNSKQLKLYDGYRHGLLAGEPPEHETIIFRDILNYCRSVIGSSS